MSFRRDNEFHSFSMRPAASAGAASASGEPAATGWTLLAVSGMRWLRAQQARRWWLVLVIGAVALGVAWLVMVPGKLSGLVPIYAAAFALLIPLTVLVAWWERRAKDTPVGRDLPLAVAAGLVAGVVSGLALYSGWLKLNLLSWQGALVLAVGEELLKTLAVAYFLWSPRVQSVRDGMRLGIAAALSFTVSQMALASYLAYHATVGAVPGLAESLFRPGVANMDHMLAFQLALQVLGEVVWTALLCAAIWRERGSHRFQVTPGLVVIAVAVVALHAAFNFMFLNGWLDLQLGGVYLPLASMVVALIGYEVLRFFITETREHEALGAVQPSPLLPALGTYLVEWRGRLSRWYAGVVTAAAQGTSAKPTAGGGAQQRTPTDTSWLR